jgi:hypothetical protein
MSENGGARGFDLYVAFMLLAIVCVVVYAEYRNRGEFDLLHERIDALEGKPPPVKVAVRPPTQPQPQPEPVQSDPLPGWATDEGPAATPPAAAGPSPGQHPLIAAVKQAHGPGAGAPPA